MLGNSLRRAVAPVAMALGLAAAPWGAAGTIPFAPGVEVSMPRQRAVVAYTGSEQVLVLASDLEATQPTKVLCVVPFPSRPTLKKSELSLFRKGTDQINSKLFPYGRKAPVAQDRRTAGQEGAAPDAGAAQPDGRPAGEVAFREVAPVEDLQAVQLAGREEFARWVQDYLRTAGVREPALAPGLRAAVDEYLADGFRWFAFHVVEAGPKAKTTEAVQYRFATRALYYPLRIGRNEQGAAAIQVVIVSPRLVRMPDLPSGRVRLTHDPVWLTEDELGYLDEELDSLLEHRRGTKLRLWEIKGRLSGFKSDVWTTWY